MGTKVQYRSYFPGYSLMRDLNEESDSGSWPLYCEDKIFKSRHYYNSFFPRPTTDGYSQHDKELLKQTMLKHETIFRNQVCELHRLYRIQMDLMEEFKRKGLNKFVTSAEALPSNPLSSESPSENPQKMWHIPSVSSFKSPSCRSPISGTEKLQFSLINEGSSSVCNLPTQNGHRFRDWKFESKTEKHPRRTFDLQLPADNYIDGEDSEQVEEKIPEEPIVTSYPIKRNCAVELESDARLALSKGGNPFRPDDSNSNKCTRDKIILNDLNQPLQIEEATSSTPVNDLLGHLTYHGGSRENDISMKQNSGFLSFPGEFFRHTQRGMNHGTHINVLHSEKECSRQERRFCNLESGQSSSKLASFSDGIGSDEFHMASEPMKTESKKALEIPAFLLGENSKRKPWTETAICGTDISERSKSSSNHSLYGLVDDIAIFGAPSVSSLRNPTCGLHQNVLSLQASSCFITSAQFNEYSNRSIEVPQHNEDQWHLKNHLGSNSSSITEEPYRNGFCHRPQSDSKVSQAMHSGGFDYLNCSDNISGSKQFEDHRTSEFFKCSGNVKSAIDINLNLNLPNGFQEGMVPKREIVIIDEEVKIELPGPGGLPWLRSKPACKDGAAKGGQDSNRIESSFAQASKKLNCKIKMEKISVPCSVSASASCTCDAEGRGIEMNECLTVKKILGFPLFCKSHISKDISPLRSPSHLHQDPSEIEVSQNSGRVGVVNIDLSKDLAEPDIGQQLSSENAVLVKEEEKSRFGFRNQFNLNSYADEEEPTECSVPRWKTKRAIEIDLEVPAVPDASEVMLPEEESLTNQQKAPALPDPSLEIVKAAAEAIVIISSAVVHNCSRDITSFRSEAFEADSLRWFAKMVTLFADDNDIRKGVNLRGKGNVKQDESSADESDYFEKMTLKMPETKTEEHLFQYSAKESRNDEETCTPLLVTTRRRRGQSRRGRQQRDFQRDFLPGLASLSRHEVTEDLQTIGGLMRATGQPWQTRLARRNGWARGRKRSQGPCTADPAITTCSPPRPQLNNCEIGVDECSLKGWGKTTRRPRRQRCAAGNPTSPVPATQV